MPKRKRAAPVSWLFRDKLAVVSTPDSDMIGQFHVSVKYDESKAEGSIVIHHSVLLEGFCSEQNLDLVLRPETIATCDLSSRLESSKLPAEAFDLISTDQSDVWCMSLSLHKPGTVICPPAPLPLSFVPTGCEKQFTAFSRLCRATKLKIYIGTDQADHLICLERFVSRVALGELRANPIDLRRLGGGEGKQEATWGAIHPSPWVEAQTAAGSMKRHCDDSRIQLIAEEADTQNINFFWDMVPPGSPTVENTPSTRHTPSIQDAATFGNGEPHLFNSLTKALKHQTPSDISTNAGSNPGSRTSTPLPEYPTNPDNLGTPSPLLQKPDMSPWSSSGISAANIKPTAFTKNHKPLINNNNDTHQPIPPDLTEILTTILHQTLPSMIESAFSTTLGPLLDSRLENLISSKLESLVHDHLPNLTTQALEQNMSTFIDDLDASNKAAEITMAETLDEAKMEIHEARDNGVDEIETWARERMEGFEEDVEGVVACAVEDLEDKSLALEGRLDRRFRDGCREMRRVGRRNSV